MHLPPEVWGPIFWATMHIAALGYADEPTYAEKRAAKEFYMALQYMLPCPVCRDHFKDILVALPVDAWLDNRKSLTEWTWMAHNQVNQRLGRQPITKDEFFARYREMAERGLPIPPAAPTAELSEAAMTSAWTRGASTTVVTLVALGIMGGLLWSSYGGSGSSGRR